jgi:hypothetical protein
MNNEILTFDFLPIFPVYRLKNTGETNENLANLLSKSKTLTLNIKSLTGFDEIELVPLQEKIDKKYHHLLNSCEKTYQDIDILVNDMQNCLSDIIYQILIKPEPKIFFVSSGGDSRIIAAITKSLENKYGKSLTDNIIFVCHHPEAEAFKNAMKQIGWPKDKYHIHKENLPENGDYYDVGNFDFNMNCFDFSALNFWSDIVPKGKECEYSIISGLLGGELLSNPLWLATRENHKNLLDNRYEYIKMHEYSFLWHIAHMRLLWKNAYFPYTNFDYLNITFRIHESLYSYYDPNGKNLRRIDRIRKAILNNFNDKTEIYLCPKYDLYLSKERGEYVQNCWIKSKFYNDFKTKTFVKDAKPGLSPRKTLDNKLYSLATVYENIKII